MNYKMRLVITLLSVPLVTSCDGGEDAPEPMAEEADSAMAGMEGMEGMGGMRMSGAMMERMRAHMGQIDGRTGEQMMADLPRHRQMVANMISQMNREMREMDMAADEEWSSTIGALREDLRRLPEMSGEELESFMPDHRKRVMRLMEMHESMMAGM